MASLLNSLKLFLISTGLFFTALGLNVSFATITEFMATHVPLTWLKLKPPYLIFLLLNAIIITIAATSKFHHPNPTPSANYVPPPQEEPAEPSATELEDVKAVVVNGVSAVEEDGTVTENTEDSMEENSPTFDDVWKTITERRNNPNSSSTSLIRRELSQDELNRRVEAFITKFNADVRLQKQESLNRYMDIGNGRLRHFA